MPIAVLSEFPKTPEAFSVWNAVHQSAHRDISRVIFQITGEVLSEYILDPFDPADPTEWLMQHQIMHQQMDQILGIAPNNLSNVDFFNRSSASSWIALHEIEHRQAADILGLG